MVAPVARGDGAHARRARRRGVRLRAGDVASGAVRVGIEGSLAAVRGEAVAVAESGVARRDGARAARTRGRRVGQGAWRARTPAGVHTRVGRARTRASVVAPVARDRAGAGGRVARRHAPHGGRGTRAARDAAQAAFGRRLGGDAPVGIAAPIGAGRRAACHAGSAGANLAGPAWLPWLTALPATHSGPDEQDIVPLWHVLPVGVHSAFGVHETQLPAPSQTPIGTVAVSHDLPAAAFVVWSVHVATPAVQAVTLPR